VRSDVVAGASEAKPPPGSFFRDSRKSIAFPLGEAASRVKKLKLVL